MKKGELFISLIHKHFLPFLFHTENINNRAESRDDF